MRIRNGNSFVTIHFTIEKHSTCWQHNADAEQKTSFLPVSPYFVLFG